MGGVKAKRSAVQRFLAWLEDEVPKVHASLAPPASAASLKELVATCGKLPDSFVEFYRAHDGQLDEDIDFVPYFYLMPVSHIVESWSDLQNYEESFEWPPSWIPFARFDCDYLFVDAQTGRVLEFFLKFPDRPVIAKGFGEFLAQIQMAVAQGSFLVTDDGLGEHPEAKLAWTAAWERAIR